MKGLDQPLQGRRPATVLRSICSLTSASLAKAETQHAGARRALRAQLRCPLGKLSFSVKLNAKARRAIKRVTTGSH